MMGDSEKTCTTLTVIRPLEIPFPGEARMIHPFAYKSMTLRWDCGQRLRSRCRDINVMHVAISPQKASNTSRSNFSWGLESVRRSPLAVVKSPVVLDSHSSPSILEPLHSYQAHINSLTRLRLTQVSDHRALRLHFRPSLESGCGVVIVPPFWFLHDKFHLTGLSVFSIKKS